MLAGLCNSALTFLCRGCISFHLTHLEVQIYMMFQTMSVPERELTIFGNDIWVGQLHFKFSKVFIKTTHCFKSPATSKHKSPTDPATLLQAPKSPQPRFPQSQLLSQISMSISRWQLQHHDRCNTAWRSSLQHFSWHLVIGEGGLGPRFLKIWNVLRVGYS